MSLLKLAGVLSACVTALHVFIIFAGAPAYRYFGAGEQMARLVEQGSPIPALLTLCLALIFAVWAAYAFSGAGLLKRLPLLRTGLILIGVIYTLRGLLLVPEAAWFLLGRTPAIPLRQTFFSLGSLVTGVAYLVGTRSRWGQLRGPSISGQG